MMKAQSLPMRTIAIIGIALVGLSIIAIFFFSGYSQGKNATNTFINTSQGEASKAQCESASFGSCPDTRPYCNPENGECVATCTGTYNKVCHSSMNCVSSCADCSEPYNCNGVCVEDCNSECSGKTDPASAGDDCV